MRKIIVLVLCGLSFAVSAHSGGLTHSCKAPVAAPSVKLEDYPTTERIPESYSRPAYDAEVSQEYKRIQSIQEYNTRVELYRACMQKFIDDQDESISRHVTAADNAEHELAEFQKSLLKGHSR